MKNYNKRKWEVRQARKNKNTINLGVHSIFLIRQEKHGIKTYLDKAEEEKDLRQTGAGAGAGAGTGEPGRHVVFL